MPWNISSGYAAKRGTQNVQTMNKMRKTIYFFTVLFMMVVKKPNALRFKMDK